MLKLLERMAAFDVSCPHGRGQDGRQPLGRRRGRQWWSGASAPSATGRSCSWLFARQPLFAHPLNCVLRYRNTAAW